MSRGLEDAGVRTSPPLPLHRFLTLGGSEHIEGAAITCPLSTSHTLGGLSAWPGLDLGSPKKRGLYKELGQRPVPLC